ncbi:MAG: hypothetical protein VR65_19855 [Desulfobulbaceae bacterium BRH_c16a]|nr:MAG: hypothetical protein VR65_19855 [Desulfobulbaceae bacterium BRH_c16a]
MGGQRKNTGKKSVSLFEITIATGKDKSSVRRRLADPAKYPYVWKNGGKGKEKHFYFEHLPEDIRVALVRHEAAPVQSLPLVGTASAGAAVAEKLLRDAAEKEERIRDNKERGLALFETLTEKRKKEAIARHDFLMACDGFVARSGLPIRKGASRSKAGDILFIETYNKGLIELDSSLIEIIGPTSSYSTLRRIAEAYETEGLYGLAFKHRNPSKGSTSVPEHIRRFIIGVKFDKPHAKVKWIMKMIRAEFNGEKLPGYSAVRRFVNTWESENRNLLLSITNPDEYKNKIMSAMGNASENIVRLNQVWELDSTPGDVMLTDGRHNIVGIVEVFSRRFRLLVSPSSNAEAVASLIRRCLLEWGVPEVATIDNGKDYVSDHVTRVLTGLDIFPNVLPPFSPEKKPHVERAFQTFSHGIVEYLPGYIGHSVAERKALEARKSFSQRLFSKGEVIQVELSSADLQDICDRWIDSMYLHEPHGGLNGATPMEIVRRWPEPVREIKDERALDMLLAPAPKDGGMRTIQKKGVKVDNAWYTAALLMGHEREGRQVKVLLDRLDLGVVYVYFVRDTHLEFLCKAYCKARDGVNPQEVAAVGRAMQNKYYSEKRAEARKMAKEVGKAASAQEILRQREGERGTIFEFPKKKEEYSSPGLEEAARAARALDPMHAAMVPATLSEEEEAIAAEMIGQQEPRFGGPIVDARSKFQEKKLKDAGDSGWQELDGFERYEFIMALPAMTESMTKWVAYFKTTSEYEALRDIYEVSSM